MEQPMQLRLYQCALGDMEDVVGDECHHVPPELSHCV